ncbi:hypothetical protein NPIL_458621, partial [Nephila pilipes]
MNWQVFALSFVCLITIVSSAGKSRRGRTRITDTIPSPHEMELTKDTIFSGVSFEQSTRRHLRMKTKSTKIPKRRKSTLKAKDMKEVKQNFIP